MATKRVSALKPVDEDLTSDVQDRKRDHRVRIIEHNFHWMSSDPGVGEVVIPLKFKVKLLRKMREMEGEDLKFMFFMLEELTPGYQDNIDEMDMVEFQTMFSEWQAEWQSLQGASVPQS